MQNMTSYINAALSISFESYSRQPGQYSFVFKTLHKLESCSQLLLIFNVFILAITQFISLLDDILFTTAMEIHLNVCRIKVSFQIDNKYFKIKLRYCYMYIRLLCLTVPKALLLPSL